MKITLTSQTDSMSTIVSDLFAAENNSLLTAAQQGVFCHLASIIINESSHIIDMTLGRLAEMVGVHRTTLSRYIKVLVDAGYLSIIKAAKETKVAIVATGMPDDALLPAETAAVRCKIGKKLSRKQRKKAARESDLKRNCRVVFNPKIVKSDRHMHRCGGRAGKATNGVRFRYVSCRHR